MQAQSSAISKRNSIIAAVCTFIFHAAVILLLYLYLIYTPIPPFPEGGGGGGLGIEVNLGNSEFGLGDVQEKIAMPDFSAPAKTKTSNDKILTQDNESSTVLNENNKTKAKQNTEVDVNPNALYKGSNKGASQGTKGGHGDQGNPNGNPNANNYTGTGHGPGTGGGEGGGNGTGHGPGNGPGTGPGNSGIHYDLQGRTFKSLPKPSYNSRDVGIVVVTIWVDKKGNVIKVQTGARGTTTTKETLWKSAEGAAKIAKFNVKPDAPEEQKGTITYNFINLN
jgi:TonB family protein